MYVALYPTGIDPVPCAVSTHGLSGDYFKNDERRVAPEGGDGFGGSAGFAAHFGGTGADIIRLAFLSIGGCERQQKEERDDHKEKSAHDYYPFAILLIHLLLIIIQVMFFGN